MALFFYCFVTGFFFSFIDLLLVYQEAYKSDIRKGIFKWSILEFSLILLMAISSTYMHANFAPILLESSFLLICLIAVGTMATGTVFFFNDGDEEAMFEIEIEDKWVSRSIGLVGILLLSASSSYFGFF